MQLLYTGVLRACEQLYNYILSRLINVGTLHRQAPLLHRDTLDHACVPHARYTQQYRLVNKIETRLLNRNASTDYTLSPESLWTPHSSPPPTAPYHYYGANFVHHLLAWEVFEAARWCLRAWFWLRDVFATSPLASSNRDMAAFGTNIARVT